MVIPDVASLLFVAGSTGPAARQAMADGGDDGNPQQQLEDAFTWCGPAWSVWRCSPPSRLPAPSASACTSAAPSGWTCHSLGGATAALHATARLLLLRGSAGHGAAAAAAQDRLLRSLQARHDIAFRPARLPFSDDPGALLAALLPPPGSAESASPCRLAWTPPPGVAPGLRTLTVALPPNAVTAAINDDQQQHACPKLLASLRGSLLRTLGLQLGESKGDAGGLRLSRISTGCASIGDAATPTIKFAAEAAAPAVLERIALLFIRQQQQQQQQQRRHHHHHQHSH